MATEITLVILVEMFHFVVHWLQSFGVTISVIHRRRIKSKAKKDSLALDLNLAVLGFSPIDLHFYMSIKSKYL
jgi:hypothetical protein